MAWHPLKSEPDPVQIAFLDAVRATILPIDVYGHVARAEDNMLAVDLADGRRVLVGFEVRGQASLTFQNRLAVRYDLAGRAVLDGKGYGLAAHAVLDVKRRAFLDLGCDTLWIR